LGGKQSRRLGKRGRRRGVFALAVREERGKIRDRTIGRKEVAEKKRV